MSVTWESIGKLVYVLFEWLYVDLIQCHELTNPPWQEAGDDLGLAKERLGFMVPRDKDDLSVDDIDVACLKKAIPESDGGDLLSTSRLPSGQVNCG